MQKMIFWTLACFLTFFNWSSGLAQEQKATSGSSAKRATQIFAHFMPWFGADAEKEKWGYHWTMNSVDPNQFESNGSSEQRKIAAHYYPEIGLFGDN